MPSHDYSTEEIIEMGDMSVSCQSCRAKKWKKKLFPCVVFWERSICHGFRIPLSHSDICSRVTSYNHDTFGGHQELQVFFLNDIVWSQHYQRGWIHANVQGSRTSLLWHWVAASNAEYESTISPNLLCG